MTTAVIMTESINNCCMKTELHDPNVMDELLKDTLSFSKRDLGNLGRYKRERSHGNKVQVEYIFGKGCESGIGRVFPKNGIGLQSFPHDMRNPLLEKYYWDCDIENCHYHILSKLAKNWNLKTEAIDQYLNNRDIELAKISDNRKVAKTAFLKVAYGGKIKEYNEYYSDEGIPIDANIELLKAIEKEMNVIVEFCWIKHVQYQKIVKKKDNPKFSVFALVLQTEERKCLLAMESYLKTQNRYIGIYIHDSGGIAKLEGEIFFPDVLLRGAESYIKEHVGYEIKLKIKPYQHNFKIINKEDSYEYVKELFEKNNFKLNNPPTFVRIHNKELQQLSSKDFSVLYGNLKYGNSEKFITKWLDDPTIRTYEKLLFNPTGNIESESYNLFQGFKTEPIEGDISVVQDVLKLISGKDDTCYEYIESCMAWIIQCKGKLGMCLIIQSNEEGAGKDSYFDLIGRILGQYFKNAQDIDNDILGRFNGQMKGKLLVKLEEFNFMDVKHTAFEKMKSYIAADEVTYEDKGIKSGCTLNFTTFVGTTNAETPVPLHDTSRRFFVQKASNDRVGDIEYWQKTQPILHDSKTASAYMYHLLHKNISEFNPRIFPKTEYFNEIKSVFIPFHASYLQDLIQNNGELKFTVKELVEQINSKSKFNTNPIKLGKAMKVYVDANVILKQFSAFATKYEVNPILCEKFLKNKLWWHE